jgi:RNA polymerase nonessential primary-like sigma factor
MFFVLASEMMAKFIKTCDFPPSLDNLSKLLEKLTPVQQKVITWRFGLEDDCELTLSQISSRLNLSRERIRQIQYQAMAILRRHQADIH